MASLADTFQRLPYLYPSLSLQPYHLHFLHYNLHLGKVPQTDHAISYISIFSLTPTSTWNAFPTFQHSFLLLHLTPHWKYNFDLDSFPITQCPSPETQGTLSILNQTLSLLKWSIYVSVQPTSLKVPREQILCHTHLYISSSDHSPCHRAHNYCNH